MAETLLALGFLIFLVAKCWLILWLFRKAGDVIQAVMNRPRPVYIVQQAANHGNKS